MTIIDFYQSTLYKELMVNGPQNCTIDITNLLNEINDYWTEDNLNISLCVICLCASHNCRELARMFLAATPVQLLPEFPATWFLANSAASELTTAGLAAEAAFMLNFIGGGTMRHGYFETDNCGEDFIEFIKQNPVECRDLANISAKIIEFHWKANCFSDSDYKLIYRLGEYCRIVRWFDYGMLDILPDLVKLQEFQVPASLIIGSMLEEWELQKHIGLDTWHHYQKQIEMVAQLLGESSVPLVSTRINFEYPLLG